MLIRQLARGVGLVQLLHQSVQFGVALLRLDNLQLCLILYKKRAAAK